MKPIARFEDFPFERKAWYSTAEIGHLLGVSATTVRRWISSGKLFAAQPSARRYRIPLASFMQYLGVPPQIRVTRGRNARRFEDDEFVRAES
jgi:excisionase family DNA binding protein